MPWLLDRWVDRETGLPPVLGKEFVFNILRLGFACLWIMAELA